MYKTIWKYITIATLSFIGIIGSTQNGAVSATELSTVRISGETRYQTATNISKAGFDKSDTVFIANAMNFADALAGGPLAFQKDAPILLAHGSSLRAETINEIKRLGARNVIILGGEAAISKSIENELKKLGLSTERLAGETRFDTAQVIADKLTRNSNVKEAVVVDGYNFADALSIAPFAAKKGMPIYLTRPAKLHSETQLKKYTKTYVIGGETAVSKNVESKLNNPTRLAGADRFQTNLKVLNHFSNGTEKLSIATGMNFADALTGSVLAAKNNTGILLTKNSELSDIQKDSLNKGNYKKYTILGGAISVSSKVESQLQGDEQQTSAPMQLKKETNNRVKEILSKADKEAYDLAKNMTRKEKDQYVNLSQEELQQLANGVDYGKLNDEFAKLINAHRKKLGLSTLKPADNFVNGTKQIAKSLADYGYLGINGYKGHTLPNGKPTHSVYSKELLNKGVGENIAFKYNANNPYEIVSEKFIVEYFFDQWMNSPSHRANMEDKLFRGFTIAAQPVTNGKTRLGTRDANGIYTINGLAYPHYGVGIISVLTLVDNL
ncbi:cell wall-binding repeat-containing protein [Marinilactibacillus sp. GCM10026970]|uniref:cell wall-binding repeat-containing protein n=1 Tax=Marinilactibacillus sp. GCM10026970 TaxID=3252642 RepID=UPI003619C5E0